MQKRWVLNGVAADGSRVAHEIRNLPFRIGRDPENDLVLAALGLSRRHATLGIGEGGRLTLTDLRSTNGTFVNRARVTGSCLLNEGDVIHFASAEFRLAPQSTAGAEDVPATMISLGGAPGVAAQGRAQAGPMRELLGGRGLAGAVQPIVQARSGVRFAFELLGRGAHPALPASPVPLFDLAALLGCEAELSRALRDHGIRAVAERAPGSTLFINTHPSEIYETSYLAALAEVMRDGLPVDLVVEIHEGAVMDVARMREFAEHLREIGVRFAYDDFGAGRARLNELGEVPADFVKFDRALVHGLDEASIGKQKMVGDLVRLVQGLGSVPLAEGVEHEADAVVCRQMGFELIQGYATGRPVGLETL